MMVLRFAEIAYRLALIVISIGLFAAGDYTPAMLALIVLELSTRRDTK